MFNWLSIRALVSNKIFRFWTSIAILMILVILAGNLINNHSLGLFKEFGCMVLNGLNVGGNAFIR